MLKIVQLCDYLTPTTLAQIIKDVDDARQLQHHPANLNLDEVRSMVADALNANVGEHDAAVLIVRAKRLG